jgi:hypothetical protein
MEMTMEQIVQVNYEKQEQAAIDIDLSIGTLTGGGVVGRGVGGWAPSIA